jgi:hypothetical protein
MFIFVDESGTFTESAKPDSWCVVAAYAIPENQIAQVRSVLRRLRAKHGGTETKLAQVREPDYFEALRKLSLLPGLGFAVACDVNLHSREVIEAHRDVQAKKVVEHIQKMRFEEGRKGLQQLADDLRALPFQLYAQLILQVILFEEVLRRAPLYYAQRRPHALANFRWRLDRKDTIPTAYEQVFRRILPVLLQTASLREPMIALSDGADYSFFRRFEYSDGQLPAYLKEDYGIQVNDGFNIGLILREDFELIDSATDDGIQVADLLSSGVRRLLRGGFADEVVAARLLGANMASTIYRVPVIKLASLGRESVTSSRVAKLIGIMDARAKLLLRS